MSTEEAPKAELEKPKAETAALESHGSKGVSSKLGENEPRLQKKG